jgi:hypothetical protein
MQKLCPMRESAETDANFGKIMSEKHNTLLASYKDAATRVTTYLQSTQQVTLKPAAVLEVIARVLNASNWQTLHGMAKAGRVPSLIASTAGDVDGPHPLASLPRDPAEAADNVMFSLRTGEAYLYPIFKGTTGHSLLGSRRGPQDEAVSAIEFSLRTGDAASFLKYWLHGEWDVIRRNWPDAPEACFVPQELFPAENLVPREAAVPEQSLRTLQSIGRCLRSPGTLPHHPSPSAALRPPLAYASLSEDQIEELADEFRAELQCLGVDKIYLQRQIGQALKKAVEFINEYNEEEGIPARAADAAVSPKSLESLAHEFRDLLVNNGLEEYYLKEMIRRALLLAFGPAPTPVRLPEIS